MKTKVLDIKAENVLISITLHKMFIADRLEIKQIFKKNYFWRIAKWWNCLAADFSWLRRSLLLARTVVSPLNNAENQKSYWVAFKSSNLNLPNVPPIFGSVLLLAAKR